MSDPSVRPGSEADGAAEFQRLVATALELQRSGRAEEALEIARRAEALAPPAAEAPSLDLAHARNFLGVVFFGAGYFRTALTCYQGALAETQRIESGAEDLLASLNNNLGQVHEQLGALDEAQRHLQAAVSMRRAMGETKVLGFALDNLASVRSQQGDLAEAEEMHQEALAIFRRAGGPFDTHVATALGHLSIIYRKRRDFERSEAYRLRALDAHLRSSGPSGQETLSDVANLIAIYWDSGDVARADALVNHLLTAGGDTASPAHRNLAEALRQLLQTAFNEFRLDLAERLATRVIELLEATEGPVAPETLAAVHQLANVSRAAGDRDGAERAYRRARSGYESLEMPDQAVAVAIDLCKLYRDAGAYEPAAQVLEACLAHLRGVPVPDRHMIASALGNLALVHWLAERHDAADAAIATALEEVEQDPQERLTDRPWLLHNRAMFKYHLGDHEAALELYQEAKRLWSDRHGGDHPFVATCVANLALVHWALGNHAAALTCFAEAETLTDREMQRVLAVGSEKKRAAYAQELLGNLYKVVTFCLATAPAGGAAARFAAQMLLRRKGRVLDAIAHTLTRVREQPRREDQVLIARLQAVREEIASLMAPLLITRRPTDEGEKLRRLRDEEEQLEATLSHRGALYRPGLDAVTLQEVQARLHGDHVLVELLRYPPFDPTRTGKHDPWKGACYAAMVLRASGDPQWFDLGPAAAIDAAVDRWRRLLRDSRSDLDELGAVGAELYGALIAPLRVVIGEASRLLVSPDGKLVLIPFGLLRAADGRTLQDGLTVSYLSSGRELVRPDGAGPRAGGIVVVAAPDFDADDDESTDAAESMLDGDFEPLPETAAEAEAIGRLFEGVTPVTGPDATARELRLVSRPLVLHVATHGLFAEIKAEDTHRHSELMSVGGTLAVIDSASSSPIANPMYSAGLVLAGANRRRSGVLMAQEIAGLDLRGTALAVLSACDTGLGTVKQGEEFTGLRRALAIAGAETQVTSLWRVGDVATRVLMIAYYQLLAAGEGRADALRFAQSRLVKAHPEWRHPAFWAAFISAGAHGPIGAQLRRRDGAPAAPPGT